MNNFKLLTETDRNSKVKSVNFSVRLFIIFTFIVGFLAALPAITLAQASPRLYLDPATATVAAGSTVNLEVKIDTADQEVAAADAKISFPPATIGIVSVTAGEFFPKLSKVINSTTGLIDLHAYFDSTDITSKSGAGTVAVITVKGAAGGGAEIALSCVAGSTTDSNIANPQGQDIISCPQSSDAEITVTPSGQGGGSILTPTPTPSTLPQAGSITPTIGLLTMGIVFFTTGTLLAATVKIKK